MHYDWSVQVHYYPVKHVAYIMTECTQFLDHLKNEIVNLLRVHWRVIILYALVNS